MYRPSLAAGRRHRRPLGGLIELALRLRVEDEEGRPRRCRQVKREVQEFLSRLARDTAADAQDAPVARHVIQTVRNRWWGLFTCYRVRGLPATNNDQETSFHRLKQGQRRIRGRKSVQEFVVRYGAYAACLDPRETFDQLLERLRQVSDAEFQQARQGWREHEAQLHKIHRFRHHRAKFLKELEAEWGKLTQR